METIHTTVTSPVASEQFDESSHLADFIMGITFEIWEQGQVDRILDYYAPEVAVFSMDGQVHGAATMVENTRATMRAFPDRLLLADEVIHSGDMVNGFSSHRLTSPMTNLGASMFGPATGRRVHIMNVADCEITDGKISREWLVRDNLALVQQLGIEPEAAAQKIADTATPELIDWLAQEYDRTRRQESRLHRDDPVAKFALRTLNGCWVSGNPSYLESVYAPYCFMHRAPFRLLSGRQQILDHYAQWRHIFPTARLSIDHVCSQPAADPANGDNMSIAVRWSVAGTQQGRFAGRQPDQHPIYILGVTHWKLVAGRIVSEWTVFDELAMLAQTLR